MCSTGRGRGGAMCVVWWWKVLESRGRGGDAPQGSRRPRGGCHRGLGHMHCDSAGPWQASASRRLRKGCPGAMSSTRTTQIWRGASIGRAVRCRRASCSPSSDLRAARGVRTRSSTPTPRRRTRATARTSARACGRRSPTSSTTTTAAPRRRRCATSPSSSR